MIDRIPKRWVDSPGRCWPDGRRPWRRPTKSAVIRAVTEYDRDTSKAVMRRQLAVTRQMIQPDPGIPIGHIDTAAWQQTEQIMVRQKLIPRPVNVIGRLDPRYAP
jgi:hypothetical protein